MKLISIQKFSNTINVVPLQGHGYDVCHSISLKQPPPSQPQTGLHFVSYLLSFVVISYFLKPAATNQHRLNSFQVCIRQTYLHKQ